jgi:hypothetical protein
MRQRFFATLITWSLFILAACAGGQANPPPSPAPPTTTAAHVTPTSGAPAAQVTPAETATPPPTSAPTAGPNSSPPIALLPAAVYLIEADSGQVVRLEADGTTVTQITFEAEPVRALSVSAAGGIVYLIGAGNDMTLVSLDSSGRRELARGALSLPRVSPNGESVVYRIDDPAPGLPIGQDDAPSGVWSQASSGMRPSLLRADAPAGVFDDAAPAWVYLPVAWSPTGDRVALFAYDADGPGVPGGELVIVDPTGAQAEVRGLSCCETERWSADGRYLTVAGGGPGPDVRYGLYQLDAATGAETAILEPDETTTPFVAAPEYLADGMLYAFVELVPNSDAGWEYPFTPALAVVAADGTVTPLRPADLTPYEVLWDPAAGGALISFDLDSTAIESDAGPLAWLAVGAQEPVRLPIAGSGLHWVPPAPLAAGDCGLFAPLTYQPRATRSFDPNVRDMQARLNARGFDAGPADGFFGEQTRAALEAFQASASLPLSGQLDCASWQGLLADNR